MRLLKNKLQPIHQLNLKKLANWQQVAETETILNSTLPVRNERPYIVQQLKPVQFNDQWWLQDEAQKMMQLKDANNTIWKLLSLSGGNAMDMAVIGKEHQYQTVGVWHNNEYKIL